MHGQEQTGRGERTENRAIGSTRSGGLGGAHAGEDDYMHFLALERVDGVNLHFVACCRPQHVHERLPHHLALLPAPTEGLSAGSQSGPSRLQPELQLAVHSGP